MSLRFDMLAFLANHLTLSLGGSEISILSQSLFRPNTFDIKLNLNH